MVRHVNPHTEDANGRIIPDNPDLYDDDGQIKDAGKWNFKKGLREIEVKLITKEMHPIYNLDKDIEEYIKRSFDSTTHYTKN